MNEMPCPCLLNLLREDIDFVSYIVVWKKWIVSYIVVWKKWTAYLSLLLLIIGSPFVNFVVIEVRLVLSKVSCGQVAKQPI
jgi:hypothetical protein